MADVTTELDCMRRVARKPQMMPATPDTPGRLRRCGVRCLVRQLPLYWSRLCRRAFRLRTIRTKEPMKMKMVKSRMIPPTASSLNWVEEKR